MMNIHRWSNNTRGIGGVVELVVDELIKHVGYPLKENMFDKRAKRKKQRDACTTRN
jgi:hypothetical protein